MLSSQPTSGELPDPVPAPRSDLGRLFLLGFVSLVLALAMIRYLAGSVFAPGCFPELVLVAALLGAGAGCLLHHHVPGRLSSIVFAASSLGVLLLVVLARFGAPAFPGPGSIEIELTGALSSALTSGDHVFFVALFLSIAFTFYCVTQRAAKLFGGFAALTACSVTVGGALAGTLAFMLLGWLDASPWIWFLLLIPPFGVVIGRDPRLPRLAAPVVLLCVSGLSLDQDLLLRRDPAAEGQLAVHWSPYDKIEHLWDPDDATHQVFVNGVAFQEMLPSRSLARSCPWAVHSARSAAGQPPYARVLVLGAGVGNDVAAALANGATHVDAVEIDPVLADIGRRHHPLHPYRDPKVTLAIDDPRAFLRRSSRRHDLYDLYDLIVVAPTRRAADVGPLAQLRRGGAEQLPPGIRPTRATDIFVCGQRAVVDRYRQEGAGARVIYWRAGLAGLLVSETAKGAPASSAAANRAAGRGDRPGVAPHVWTLVASTGAVALCLLVLGWTRRRREPLSGESCGTLSTLAFVSLGVALGVQQSQGLDRQGLFLGGTWTGAFLVFLGIMVSALVAIRLARRARTIPLWLISCLALGSGLVAASGLQFTLFSSDSPVLRFPITLFSYCPVVFGYLLFGMAIQGERAPARLAGASLLGGAVSGLLACSTQGIGHGAGAIIVAVGYIAAFGLLTLARRRGAPAASPLTGRAEQPAGPAATAAWTDARPRRLAVMLFLGLVAVYHLNGDFLPTGDAVPSGYLASSLFEEGDLSVTPKEAPFMFREWGRPRKRPLPSVAKDGHSLSVYQERYYLVPTRHTGVFVSTFGPGPTIAALPIFALLRLTCGNLASHPTILWYGAKSAAVFYVAGSAVFVFLAALLFVRTRQALLIAAAYGLGTCVWSISSQALWQHGPNAFFLAMGSYFFLRHQRDREKARSIVFSGVAFGCAVCCRPSSAVMVGIVGMFLLIANRRALLRFVAGGLPLAAALLYYNMHYFGSMLQTGQAVRGPSVALAKTGSAAVWQTPLWEGFLGLMVSPSRGLLVFSPFMVFALWGAIRVWRRGEKEAGLQVLSLGAASLLMMQFKWFDWWGGHAYGYRPIVDVMPILALFLVVVVDQIGSRPVLRGVFGALLAWAIVVQVVGAFAYNEQDWNKQRTEVRPMARSDSDTLSYGVPYVTRAANIDDAAFRNRLWSIRDSMILHYMRFFGDARRRKKALAVARLALAFVPGFGAVAQTACSPPLAKAGVEGVIDVGTDQAREFLRSGWSAIDEKLDARTARWALGGTARVQVSLVPLFEDRQLTFTAKPAKSQRPQRVVVNVNGAFVGKVTMARTWKTYRLLVPKAVLRPGVNHIDFKHDWCIRPMTFDPTSKDLRHLAAAYDRITLTALERSPEAFEAELGTTEERERLALSGGLDDQGQSGARTFVRSPGPSLSFTIPLALKSSHYLLVVEARADGVGDTSSALRVSINDRMVGRVVMDRSWATRSLVVHADALRKGINTIKLTPASLDQPDSLLSRVWLRPLHRSHVIDLGTIAAHRYMGAGWSVDEVQKKRSVVASDGTTSQINVELHLDAPRYVMKMTARAYELVAPLTVAVSCNGHHLGELIWAKDWEQRTLNVPRRFLREGANALELAYSRTVQPFALNPRWDDKRKLALVVDSVSVSPVAKGKPGGSGR